MRLFIKNITVDYTLELQARIDFSQHKNIRKHKVGLQKGIDFKQIPL